MRGSLLLILFGFTSSLLSPVVTLVQANQPAAGDLEFFEKKIRPVLVEHCYECHSAEGGEMEGGLLLDTRTAIRKGGENGPAVVPGEPRKSLLLDALEFKKTEMPPDGKLPPEVIADFRNWIKRGAEDSREGGMTLELAGPVAIAADELWSLQPIQDPQPPAVAQADWPRDDIDHFVLALHEQKGLKVVGEASPLTLLRRIYFDLIGLPPSPQAIRDFEQDHSQQALGELVDRLLESPQFGERWGRYWLDIARYAESVGGSRDVLMPHAWRYRNYVIDAINADMPFDQFLREQIAGDLLPAQNATDHDRLQIATGFLAVGTKSLNGGNLQMDIVDDQIDVTGKAVLGLAVGCARCHDHKFDPIPTADYYALAGIFRSTQTLYGSAKKQGADKAVNELLALGENVEQLIERHKDHQTQVAKINKKTGTVNKTVQALQKKLPKDWRNRSKKLREATQTKANDALPDQEKPNSADSQINEQDSKFLDEVTALEAAQRELQQLKTELKELNKSKPVDDIEYAIGVREAKRIDDTKIHIRGDRAQLGETVSRGFLSCVDIEVAKIDEQQSGRLQFADWLTHVDNPLTARVAVNRIWQHLFGRGIVATVDNFGANGMKPTHPELLDYLATQFREEKWSLKKLVRRLVLSRTYQLAADNHAENFAKDPGNEYYWRMSRRRLDAEALRDSMLAAGGRLDLERPVASPVAEVGHGEVGRGINTAPLEAPFPHRSVYLPILRGIIPELLGTFDFPEPSNPQGQRMATNVPAQSLFLMNSPFVVEQAESLADSVLKVESEPSSRVELAFLRCLNRFPKGDEVAQSLAFLKRLEQQRDNGQTDVQDRELANWTTFCHALFNTSESRYLD
ncbi:MAG: DUF1553 domain-containing protein [Pirellulaceae bacterium]|nr:DUF1553 domain-containing protein [Pirellulaceae bacterium]